MASCQTFYFRFLGFFSSFFSSSFKASCMQHMLQTAASIFLYIFCSLLGMHRPACLLVHVLLFKQQTVIILLNYSLHYSLKFSPSFKGSLKHHGALSTHCCYTFCVYNYILLLSLSLFVFKGSYNALFQFWFNFFQAVVLSTHYCYTS